VAGVTAGRVLEVRGHADRQPRFADNRLDPRNRRITILLPFVTAAEAAPAVADIPASVPEAANGVTPDGLGRVPGRSTSTAEPVDAGGPKGLPPGGR
jgi:hypothetical protein